MWLSRFATPRKLPIMYRRYRGKNKNSCFLHHSSRRWDGSAYQYCSPSIFTQWNYQDDAFGTSFMLSFLCGKRPLWGLYGDREKNGHYNRLPNLSKRWPMRIAGSNQPCRFRRVCLPVQISRVQSWTGWPLLRPRLQSVYLLRQMYACLWKSSSRRHSHLCK